MHIVYFSQIYFACIWHIFFATAFDISMLDRIPCCNYFYATHHYSVSTNVKQNVNDIKEPCQESAASKQHRLLLAINNCVIAFSAASFHLLIISFLRHPCASFLNLCFFFHKVWTSARVRSRNDFVLSSLIHSKTFFFMFPITKVGGAGKISIPRGFS